MVADQQAQSEIKNFGDLRSFLSPAGWVYRREKDSPIGLRASEYFHPPTADRVTITAFYRGSPVSDSGADAMAAVLTAKTAHDGPQDLSVEEIRSLSEVFGMNNVGDNQHTNDAPVGSHDYAVFNMQSAQTVQLNGRTVVKVRGAFQDENGTVVNEFIGFFYPAKEDRNRIEELFFQAPNKEWYFEFQPHFEVALESLQWRE